MLLAARVSTSALSYLRTGPGDALGCQLRSVKGGSSPSTSMSLSLPLGEQETSSAPFCALLISGRFVFT